MPITWQNARWLQRLVNLASPNQEEVSGIGVILPTMLVNDARYIGSRENNPVGTYGVTAGAAAAGQHNAILFAPNNTVAIHELIIHAFEGGAGAGTINLSVVAAPGALVWAAGPTTRLAPIGDQGIDQAVTCQFGEIATANLPATNFILPNAPPVLRANQNVVPRWFTRAQSFLFFNSNAATTLGMNFTAQGVRSS